MLLRWTATRKARPRDGRGRRWRRAAAVAVAAALSVSAVRLDRLVHDPGSVSATYDEAVDTLARLWSTPIWAPDEAGRTAEKVRRYGLIHDHVEALPRWVYPRAMGALMDLAEPADEGRNTLALRFFGDDAIDSGVIALWLYDRDLDDRSRHVLTAYWAQLNVSGRRPPISPVQRVIMTELLSDRLVQAAGQRLTEGEQVMLVAMTRAALVAAPEDSRLWEAIEAFAAQSSGPILGGSSVDASSGMGTQSLLAATLGAWRDIRDGHMDAPEWPNQALGFAHWDRQVQALTARRFAKWSGVSPTVAQALVTMLDDLRPDVRGRAAQAIAWSDRALSPLAVNRLLAMSMTDDDRGARGHATVALCAHAGQVGVDPMIDLLLQRTVAGEPTEQDRLWLAWQYVLDRADERQQQRVREAAVAMFDWMPHQGLTLVEVMGRRADPIKPALEQFRRYAGADVVQRVDRVLAVMNAPVIERF